MFIGVALKKLNMLIKQEDFIEITSLIEVKGITVAVIKFKTKQCTINNFGRVNWLTNDKDIAEWDTK